MMRLSLSLTLILLVLDLALNGASHAANENPSQNPPPSSGKLGSQDKSKSSKQEQQTQPDQRGTEQSPIIVKMAPSPKTEEEAAQAKQEKEEKAATDRRVEITTYIIGAATAIQAIALIWTIIVMNRTAKRQLRAYVMPQAASLIDGTMLQPPQAHRANVPGTVLNFMNFGETPAYEVVSWAQIAVTQPINENNLVVPTLQRMFAAPLGAKGTMPKALWFNRALTATERTDIANGQQAIYLYGRIEYLDAFKMKRFTNFRLHYIGQFPPLPGAVLYFSEKGNNAN